MAIMLILEVACLVFSSMVFLFAFLPITLLIYYAGNMRVKNIVLLVSGLLFYAWGEPIYVLAMIFSTLVDYTAGIFMDKYDNDKRARVICLLCSVIINLSLLGVFKYSSFIIGGINGITGLDIPDPKLPLPIGISFFTFQSMSYTIDLYRRHVKVQKNIINFTSYVSLFPQIVAGPIVRYADVAEEIDSRKISVNKIADGIGIFVKGLAKKLILANSIGAVWSTVKALPIDEIPVLSAWIGILAFTFQIYFDFSGYSDMAIGLGKMLGFNFPINFDHPYMSKSISEFWRRWHITLGSWFKSYVYIPLGGNKGSMLKTLRNLFIVWFLTGLWHGASWNFVLWGVYFGILIIIERLFLGDILDRIPKWCSWAYTFVMVVFGWVLFEFRAMPDVFSFFKALFGANGAGVLDSQSIYLLVSNLLIFVACAIGSTKLIHRIKPKHKSSKPFAYGKVAVIAVLFLVCVCYLVNSVYNPFLYFNF